MKGIIIYSSRTGNTKRMAEKIYDIIKDKYEKTINAINDVEDERETKEYEFVLLGAWIDKGTVDNKAMKLLKKVENEKVGLFATLGAMPDSEHGKKVIKNLKELLKNKESLGEYICPGLVDSDLINKLEGITGKVVPKKVKEKMIKTSLESRRATEEELIGAGNYFLEKINRMA